MIKSAVDKLFKLIKWGKEGKNIGLSMGLPKLEKVIAGIQRGIYTVVAGGTGSGKTTFALYAYIYRPLMEMLGNPKFKIVYYSLEMTAEVLLAKLASIFIWEQYGIEMPYDAILSRTEILSEEHYEILLTVREWLEKVEEHLIIYDKAITCDGIYAHLKTYAEQNGEFVDTEHGSDYIPNVDNQYVMVIVDHIGLLRRKTGQLKKEAIDLASNYLIYFRNKCGYSPVVLMQVNRQSSSMDRRNAEMHELQLDDLKDSGTPSEDAELVIALFNPFREKMVAYRDYNIRDYFKGFFRSILVLKNRYGDADKMVALNFFGSVGLFKELPPPNEINFNDPQYINLIVNNTDNNTDKVQEPISYSFTL